MTHSYSYTEGNLQCRNINMEMLRCKNYHLLCLCLVTCHFLLEINFSHFLNFQVLLMIRFSARGSYFGNNNRQYQILVGVRCTNANQGTVLKKIIKINKSANNHRMIIYGIGSWCQSGLSASWNRLKNFSPHLLRHW